MIATLSPQSQTDWPSHMDAWKLSGLTQKAYCAREGISFYSFKNRRHRLLKQGELKSPRSKDSQPLLKPVSLTPVQSQPGSGTELILELPVGIRLTIRSGS